MRVLRGVDWQAHYGEMTFLMGPSGSGKTTLLSIIAGILKADGGSVAVLGRSSAVFATARLHVFAFRTWDLFSSNST